MSYITKEKLIKKTRIYIFLWLTESNKNFVIMKEKKKKKIRYLDFKHLGHIFRDVG